MKLLELAPNVWLKEVKGMPIGYLTQREFIKEGHEVHYLVPDDGGTHTTQEGINIHRFWMPVYFMRPDIYGKGLWWLISRIQWFIFLLFGTISMARWAKKLEPDVVYGHGTLCVPPSAIVAKLRRIPNITRTYGFVFARKYTRFQHFLNFDLPLTLMLPAAAYIIGDDATCVKSLSERFGVPGDRAYYWVDGHEKNPTKEDFDGMAFRRTLGLTEESQVVLTVASLTKLKGTHNVVNAMPNVVKRHPNTVHIVVGDGPEMENLKMQAADLGVSDKVMFIGRVPQTEVWRYMGIADVVPALWSIGPLFEAMLSGKCIITIDIGETERFIQNRVNGILIEEDEIDKLSEIINELLDNDEFRLTLAENGKKWAMENLDTWEERVQKEVRLVERVVEDWKAT
ncbi:MAG: glycosyltransferase family 4 protein [Thermoplasmata archaeon]|nr:glycosyltransferase family 4 protein [Thermoplasmata archaeon]